MVRNYIPEQGDIIYIDFDPTVEHEQKGPRPALVISNKQFNEHIKMSLVCPITNNNKPHPFHIYFLTKKIKGSIMCEQLRTVDFVIRKAKFKEKIPDDILQEVVEIISSFMKI